MYTQAVRLLRLYHRLDFSPEGARVDDLAVELEVTPRSIRRDLRALDAAGVMLEFIDVDGERRVRLKRTGRNSEPIRMTRFQRYSLAAARRMFDVLAGTPLHDDLAQLFAKLVPAGNDPLDVALGGRFVFIPEAPKDYRRLKNQVYEIYDGVLRDLTLSFLYDGGSTSGVRKLEPYALVVYRNGLYVVGIDAVKRAPRTFAVERMRRVRAHQDQPFDRDPAFDPARLFDGAFGITTGGPPQHVVVDFDLSIATYIREREWHPSQKITVRDEEGIRCELDVALTEELVGWILRWGANARVVSPPELVERMRREFAQASARYARANQEAVAGAS